MKSRESIAQAVKSGQMVTKQELGKLYQVTWATIRNWITLHPQLREHAPSYRTQQNYLSPAQYRFLFEYLGEPFETEL